MVITAKETLNKVYTQVLDFHESKFVYMHTLTFALKRVIFNFTFMRKYRISRDDQPVCHSTISSAISSLLIYLCCNLNSKQTSKQTNNQYVQNIRIHHVQYNIVSYKYQYEQPHAPV